MNPSQKMKYLLGGALSIKQQQYSQQQIFLLCNLQSASPVRENAVMVPKVKMMGRMFTEELSRGQWLAITGDSSMVCSRPCKAVSMYPEVSLQPQIQQLHVVSGARIQRFTLQRYIGEMKCPLLQFGKLRRHPHILLSITGQLDRTHLP